MWGQTASAVQSSETRQVLMQVRANDSVESSAHFFLGQVTSVSKEIPIGACGEAEETVDFKHTVTSHHPELPPVYSTPDMIRLMETAAFHALQPYCEGDEITVGTSINQH
jgi:hypothetical protein